MLRDMFTNLSAVTSLAPLVRTADANGTGVDLSRHSGATLLATVGAAGVTLSGTDKIEVKVEESDDNSTFTAVAAGDLLGSTVVLDTPAEAGATYLIGYVGNKRYIRAVLDFSGTHGTGTSIGVSVVRGYPRSGTGTVA